MSNHAANPILDANLTMILTLTLTLNLSLALTLVPALTLILTLTHLVVSHARCSHRSVLAPQAGDETTWR